MRIGGRLGGLQGDRRTSCRGRRSLAVSPMRDEGLEDSVQRFPGCSHAVTLEAMRSWMALPLAVAAALAVPAGAQADLTHVVAPGETLTSVAADDGVSINALAGANRLKPNARLISGAVLRIPPRGSGFRARAAPRPTAPAAVAHRYTVRPGDTLSGLAARAGVSVSDLAHLNHISARAFLIAGATITLPGTRSSQGGPPYPTAELVTSAQVEQVAAESGVPASLAKEL